MFEFVKKKLKKTVPTFKAGDSIIFKSLVDNFIGKIWAVNDDVYSVMIFSMSHFSDTGELFTDIELHASDDRYMTTFPAEEWRENVNKRLHDFETIYIPQEIARLERRKQAIANFRK